MALRLKSYIKSLGEGDLYGPSYVENIALSFPIPPDSTLLGSPPTVHISPKEAEYGPTGLTEMAEVPAHRPNPWSSTIG